MERQFRDWLIQRGNNGAATSYPVAIHQISKHYSDQTGVPTNIYNIENQHTISEIAHDYSQSGKFSNYGYEQHGRFRAAIARYSEFFVKHLGCETFAEAASTESDNPEYNIYQNGNNFAYEKDLQTSLCSQISELFPDYQLYGNCQRGIEYSIGGKRIDVLLEHESTGELLAVELKSGLADFKVFGQLSMYIGLLKRDFPDKEIKGVIVAGAIDESLKMACSITDLVTLKVYRMILELEDA